MSTKREMTLAEEWRRQRISQWKGYFLSLLHNAIEIENLPDDVPKRYFLRVLFKCGKIGEWNGLYLKANGIGIDIYGLPTEYNLIGYNGFIRTVKAKDAKILRLNDLAIPIEPYLDYQCGLIVDIETAIRQNIEATRTMKLIECRDQASLLSIKNINEASRLGATAVFMTTAGMQDKVVVHDTGATFMCDQYMQLRKEFINETLNRLGVQTANTDKRERVQTAEVESTVGEVIDNIYVMVDTFNYDAEIAGLPLRMRVNSVVEDYYGLSQKDDKDTDNNEEVNDG